MFLEVLDDGSILLSHLLTSSKLMILSLGFSYTSCDMSQECVRVTWISSVALISTLLVEFTVALLVFPFSRSCLFERLRE